MHQVPPFVGVEHHKGHPEENAHLERSHRTDDDEFYRLRALRFHSEKHLLEEALHFIYYYNNVREHSSLDYSTPFAHLKQQNPDVKDNIRFFQPFILDDVSVKLGSWSGYNLLAQHLINPILRTWFSQIRINIHK